MHSFVDPDFRDRVYHRVLAAPIYDDLGLRSAAESAFVEAFSTTEAACLPSLELLLPTRDYNDEEMFSLISRDRADAVLIVRQTDVFKERQFVPEPTTTDSAHYLTSRSFYGSHPRRFARIDGPGDSYGGGYYVDLPRVRHELRLYDAETKRQAWFATSLTTSDASVRLERLEQSLARQAVKQLMADGVLRPRARELETD